jgi:chaperonin GroES
MSDTIQPLGDFVVAQMEKAQEKTSSGIYLPGNAQERPKVAQVVAVGKEVKQLKVGDRIVYKTYSTNEIKVGKEDYIVVKEEDVMATLK